MNKVLHLLFWVGTIVLMGCSSGGHGTYGQGPDAESNGERSKHQNSAFGGKTDVSVFGDEPSIWQKDPNSGSQSSSEVPSGSSNGSLVFQHNFDCDIEGMTGNCSVYATETKLSVYVKISASENSDWMRANITTIIDYSNTPTAEMSMSMSGSARVSEYIEEMVDDLCYEEKRNIGSNGTVTCTSTTLKLKTQQNVKPYDDVLNGLKSQCEKTCSYFY